MVYFSGGWDDNWGYGLLTHGHMLLRFTSPSFPRRVMLAAHRTPCAPAGGGKLSSPRLAAACLRGPAQCTRLAERPIALCFGGGRVLQEASRSGAGSIPSCLDMG